MSLINYNHGHTNIGIVQNIKYQQIQKWNSSRTVKLNHEH